MTSFLAKDMVQPFVNSCYLPLSSDNLCKQLGPRSGPTKFDSLTLILLLKESFENVNSEEEKMSKRKNNKS